MNLEPIFIVGAPRSGTTWLLSLLECHPQCRAVTPADLGIEVSRPTKETGVFLRGLTGEEIIRRFENLPASRVPVEKTPGHLLQVGRIKRLFPRSRIVLVRRNPEDVIWSMLQENAFWDGSPASIEAAVSLYNSHARAQHAYTGFDVVVDYESLWENPVEELGILLKKLALDPALAGDMVDAVQGGKALPKGLEGVFRKGLPGEGHKHLTQSQREYIEQQLFTPERFPFRPKVLLTANHLLGWTGTETLLMTLVGRLLDQGCRVTVFARHLDSEWLDSHFDLSVRLTDNLEDLRGVSFDLAHVHHNASLVEVRAAFPTLPVLFWSLGVLPYLEQPIPMNAGVTRYLAISEEVGRNLAGYGVPGERVSLLRNIVCEKSFYPTSGIHSQPQRVLVLSYKLEAGRLEKLKQAAGRIGASIRFLGAPGQEIAQDALCEAINEADVVVSIGRGAIEAMLCARVPLIFDVHGGDGLVTPDNFMDLISCNLSGRLTGRDSSLEELVAEFGKYRSEYGEALREMAMLHFSADKNIPKLLDFYQEVIQRPLPLSLNDEQRTAFEFYYRVAQLDRRLFNQRWSVANDARREVSRLKTTVSWRITAPLRVFYNLFRRLVRKGEPLE